ncbi:MAG TPA: GH1 family beta-glucosidase [Steroidobacter sp.]|uniref:GH1 family beta-glucosidase n=1 Tax=Steroidobacter sp. TaxID=1978227 RepID=UPI002ED9F367
MTQPNPRAIQFPSDFLWGCATSAYQIEGSPLADGAGPSVWHRFSHTPGRVQDGDTADVTCDHYRRWQSDVDLMHSLGMGSYRFSIAWGRVLPEGTGRINPAGLDFYERLVDRLLSHGIQPMVTLFHWDLPAALDDRGGWLNRDIAQWFAEYADIVFRRLDDRVKYWTTLNEPWVVADGGYMQGVLAPGHRNVFEAPRATHHLLMAHGAAVQAYRASGRNKIGLVVNIEPKYPASPSEADQAATRRAEAYMNRQYLEPALLGSYPKELQEIFGEAWPQWPDEDLKLIRQPLDYIGVNYYTRAVVRTDPSAWPLRATPVKQKQHAHMETGWEVFPQGLTDTLLWIKDNYGNPPVYVTENGACFYDPPQIEGPVLDDPLRVDYLRKHITAVYDAMQRGADIRGYFAWSLFDNFEWAFGFSKRFGIVHMNYETLQRTLKASAHFYSKVIATRGAALAE